MKPKTWKTKKSMFSEHLNIQSIWQLVGWRIGVRGGNSKDVEVEISEWTYISVFARPDMNLGWKKEIGKKSCRVMQLLVRCHYAFWEVEDLKE